MSISSESYRVSLSLEKDLVDPTASGVRPPVVRSFKDIVNVFGELAGLRREVMIAGAIDCKCRLVHYSLIAVGACDHLLVRTGDAFHGASKSVATGIFLVHNHPSGSGVPSDEDFKITERIAAAGVILGFPLFDHVIIAREHCTSLMNTATLHQRGYRVGKCRILEKFGSPAVHWTCLHCGARRDENMVSISLAITRGVCVPMTCDECRHVTWVHESRGGPQSVRTRVKPAPAAATLGMVAEQ